MKEKRYVALRAEMSKRDIRQVDLATKIGRKESYVSRRLTGKDPWSQGEQYVIMDWLRLPYDQMHIYFPKNGITGDNQEKPASTREQEVLNALRVLLRGAV